jgi:hypothetical protein
MSLIRLLSMGHALKESKDQTGLYHLGFGGAIPRFEEGRQKSAQADVVAPTPQAGGGNDGAEGATGRVWASMISGVFGQEAKRHGVVAQRRLSLDEVKVVRNDLNETDIEVVERRERPATTGREASFERRQVGGWKQLTERLFHLGGDATVFRKADAPVARPRQQELIARF